MSWESILKSPAKDRRYKLTQEDITQMNKLREEGMSNTNILRHMKDKGKMISRTTVIYWTNEEERKKQRAKNAKRKYVKGSPEDIARKKRDANKRRENWEADPDMKLRHQIQSAMDEKRPTHQRHTIHGMDMKDAKALLSSGKLQRKNKKVEE
jgi:hypothetical protein